MKKSLASALLSVASVLLLVGCGKQSEQGKADAVYQQLPQQNDSVKTPDLPKKSASAVYDQLPKNNKSIK